VKEEYTRNIGEPPKKGIYHVEPTKLFYVIDILEKKGFKNLVSKHIKTFMAYCYKSKYGLKTVTEAQGYVEAYSKFQTYLVYQWIEEMRRRAGLSNVIDITNIDLVTFKSWDQNTQDFALTKLTELKLLDPSIIRSIRNDHMILAVTDTLINKIQDLQYECRDQVGSININIVPRKQ